MIRTKTSHPDIFALRTKSRPPTSQTFASQIPRLTSHKISHVQFLKIAPLRLATRASTRTSHSKRDIRELAGSRIEQLVRSHLGLTTRGHGSDAENTPCSDL